MDPRRSFSCRNERVLPVVKKLGKEYLATNGPLVWKEKTIGNRQRGILKLQAESWQTLVYQRQQTENQIAALEEEIYRAEREGEVEEIASSSYTGTSGAARQPNPYYAPLSEMCSGEGGSEGKRTKQRP